MMEEETVVYAHSMSQMTPEDSASAQTSNSYFKCIMCFNIITSFSGIMALCFLKTSRRSRKALAHKSLTLLMNAHSSWTFLLCLSVLFLNCITLHSHLTMRIPADLLVAASTCAIRRIPSIVASYGSVFSQMAMAAERWRASKDLSNYETTNKSIGNLLNYAHLVVVLIAGAVHLSVYGSGWNWTATHCTIVNPSRLQANSTLAVFIFLCELVIIIVFKRLLSRNCRLRESRDAGLSLSERYQLSENIRMLKLLIPIIWTHTLLGMIGAVLYITMQSILPGPEMYPLIEETVNMLHLQGICIPLIFMLRFRQEDRHAKLLISMNAATGEVLASYYDKAITEGW